MDASVNESTTPYQAQQYSFIKEIQDFCKWEISHTIVQRGVTLCQHLHLE